MTAQLPLPFAPVSNAKHIGAAVDLVEDDGGGQVFLHGMLVYVWDAGEHAMRRFVAVKLWDMKTAKIAEIAAAFGVHEDTVWKWHRTLNSEGFAALSSDKPGPKGGSKLTATVITHIQELKKKTGLSNRRIGTQVGVSEFSVRRALTLTRAAEGAGTPAVAPAAIEPVEPALFAMSVPEELPVLPAPTDRTAERLAASVGSLTEVPPVFAPAARVPLAGMFFALPALETTLLLRCAPKVFTGLSNRVYGLNTLLLEGVLRTLVGEPRAEGATRLNPSAFGRVLGMDRSPEVKTIRRQYQGLVDTGKVPELMSLIAFEQFAADKNAGTTMLGILYVDGHTRAYEGGKKIGRLHSTRLKMPVPATEETWVSAANGDPLFMVMAQPSASLVSELKALVPKLRAMIGDDRRMLVGFDRGGWSPTMFAHLHKAGFDVLTWRKGTTGDVDGTLFHAETYVDEQGTTHTWDRVADTEVDVLLSAKTGDTFSMRQVSQIVPFTTRTGTRQIHILTTLDTQKTMGTAEVVFRMAARWRQENYFRFGRERFALDAHDSHASSDDDATRLVPNPAKAKAKLVQDNARNYRDAVAGTVTAAMLAINTPTPGTQGITITNQMHNDIHAPLHAAETTVAAAEDTYRQLLARVPLGESRPGQQVLDQEMKRFTHIIRMAAFNTAVTLAREIRTNTGFQRADREAHNLVRQILKQPGDIDPTQPGILRITLDPMPTPRETAAVRELCTSLTDTETHYPGTDLILQYAIKDRL
ncbi:helix-turn-helix domain-containing protein [Cryobacterium sp. PH31-L1]|uniref:helix-turn-helix domain-containing protein n=1 Tax=Cryobacterium sp. PH31-L1 TaxID=3046199 RepID=UPI0024BB532D|nr:helix-turn-helix domain-containing protein [Cryobacterium sp. PH31-L1]MDJ0376965.1 helix-turn-helix domain-containing protein [Cryobacterium sp. PH31-L1]